MATVYRRGKQLDNAFHEVPAEKEERDQSTLGSSNRYPKAFNDISQTNTSTIASYIQSMKIEINLSDHYRKDIMILLCKFSKHNNNKLFRDLTRQEILAFLNSFAKSQESDPFTSGLERTTYTKNICKGSSNGYTFLTSNRLKDQNQLLLRIFLN